MLWVGLTGGIASGKTTVSNMLRELSIPVIDADGIAHQGLVECKTEIINQFGFGVLNEKGEIDRPKLADIIFKDPEQKTKLENILHPYVQGKVKQAKFDLTQKNAPVAVYDVPLLFEKNLQSQFDQIILVYAPDEIALQRLMKRNKLNREQALLRMKNLLDIEEKKKQAHVVFENHKDLSFLKQQVLLWVASIKKK